MGTCTLLGQALAVRAGRLRLVVREEEGSGSGCRGGGGGGDGERVPVEERGARLAPYSAASVMSRCVAEARIRH